MQLWRPRSTNYWKRRDWWKIAQSVIEFRRMPSSKKLNAWRKAGLNFEVVEQEVVMESENLSGKSFGDFGNIWEIRARWSERRDLTQRRQRFCRLFRKVGLFGWQVIIWGPAKRKSREAGVKIISESDFEKIAQGQIDLTMKLNFLKHVPAISWRRTRLFRKSTDYKKAETIGILFSVGRP